MKKIIYILLALMPVLGRAQERVMLIADPHVLPQTLIETEADFDSYMSRQRKMVDLSEPIWMALMDTAMKYRPQLLLIPGDLTRDAEPESHAMVVASLLQLNEAGIQTLVIPGNHDIVNDAAWEESYAWMYERVVARDPDSHSYAAEPLDGVTVLGIDGSHTKAATGSLSEQTLAWILAQADEARRKNHMIIAMSHWQIIEHMDKQTKLESSCRMKDADAIRDSLMMHGVHVVLTGHFHVNGISTYRDVTGFIPDSLVEITTGAPITYPCPYRWLTISEDRTSLSVETQNITAIDGIPDMYRYSRAWMAEHTHNLIAPMTLRAWNRVDEAMGLIVEQFGETVAQRLMDNCIPETDSAKVALVDKHIGNTVVELYLLYSDANEPEYPQADSLAQELYREIDAMIEEALDADPLLKTVLLVPMTLMAEALAQEPVQSLVEDKTQWRSSHPDRTDDLHLTMRVGDGYVSQDLEEPASGKTAEKVLRDGQLLIRRGGRTYTVTGAEQ